MEKLKLDDLQLKIMQVLWREGEVGVSGIQEQLKAKEDRELAITTLNTVLQRLYKRGIVNYRKEGRQYIYRAEVTEKQTQASMATSLIDKLFKGKSSVLVNHLLESSAFDQDELEDLKRKIAAAQQKKKDNE
ncbi:MAG: BlaI/MecI/CopY family transcriptional regulator [Saprospiraceae bacterium]|nr:BlaI/MecI/CopY family transcriptional regulator [Saprospiraceae bacterium]